MQNHSLLAPEPKQRVDFECDLFSAANYSTEYGFSAFVAFRLCDPLPVPDPCRFTGDNEPIAGCRPVADSITYFYLGRRNDAGAQSGIERVCDPSRKDMQLV